MSFGQNAVLALLCCVAVAVLSACSKDGRAEHARRERESSVPAASSESRSTPPAAPGPCTAYSAPSEAGRVEHTELLEISGLSASHARPGVLYVHNDSGDSARFFALDSRGTALAEFSLEAAKFEDCEDIALGSSAGQAFLYLGDIGDNPARDRKGEPRQSIRIYRVPEPEVGVGQAFERRVIANWEKLDLVYPDHPHDAETLMFDSRTSDLILVTKEDAGKSGVFRVGSSSFGSERATLEKIAELEFGGPMLPGVVWTTGGDISARGDKIAIRTYSSIWLFARLTDDTLAQALGRLPSLLPAPIERQAEALGFSVTGECYFSISEGAKPAVYTACETCRAGK